MSVRNSYTDVQEVTQSTLDSSVITALIADASAWVDAYLVGKGLSEEALTAIEKYIAAHLVVQASEGASGQLIQAQREGVAERYAEKQADTSGASPYLRTAAAFDPTHTVREYWLDGKRMKAYVGSGYGFTGG